MAGWINAATCGVQVISKNIRDVKKKIQRSNRKKLVKTVLIKMNKIKIICFSTY